MKLLRAFGWVLLYLVVVPVTPLLLMASVASDREHPGCGWFCLSRRDYLLLVAGFHFGVIAPLLVGVAAVAVVALACIPRLWSASAHSLAAPACVVAVIVVFLGWVIRYPDQAQDLFSGEPLF